MVPQTKHALYFSCFTFTSDFLMTPLWFLTNIKYIQYNLESVNTRSKCIDIDISNHISNLLVHWRCRRNYHLFCFLASLSRLSHISNSLNNPLWYLRQSMPLIFLASLSPLTYGTSDKAYPLFFLLLFHLSFSYDTLMVPYKY